jgi:hypothetical protein
MPLVITHMPHKCTCPTSARTHACAARTCPTSARTHVRAAPRVHALMHAPSAHAPRVYVRICPAITYTRAQVGRWRRGVVGAPLTPPACRISFKIGTDVAVEFSRGIFSGQLSRLYADDDQLCEVTFRDGDVMDMDVPEVLKTVALFNQEQPGDESRASSCGLEFMFHSCYSRCHRRDIRARECIRRTLF